MASDLRKIIRDNVRRLLKLGPNDKGIAELVRLGLSNGTAQRLMGAETSIGIELLQTLADGLDVEPWQLCVPDLDPEVMPRLEPLGFRWPFRRIDPETITALVGTAAVNVENGLLAALATAGVQPKVGGGPSKQQTMAA